jgi:hypothetical protein
MKTRVGAVLGVLFAVGTSGCSPRESPQSADRLTHRRRP